MKRIPLLAAIIIFAFLSSSSVCAAGPDSLATQYESTGTGTDSGRYFIKVLPTDSTFNDDMPVYNPDEHNVLTNDDSIEIIYRPKIEYPADPSLRGRDAIVKLIVLVDSLGLVQRAKVTGSTDHAFDSFALRYAKQYKFKWKNKRNAHLTWVGIAMAFKQ